ncbi:MAG: HdeA/HdeB family chaperone, partial [Pseudolabrys sp.]
VAMRYSVLLVAAILSGISLPAAAQVNLDMNQITCRDWLGYDPAAQSFVRFWMSGYYNAAANGNILDYNRSQKNSAKVVAYCKTHRSQTLPTAIKNAAS